MQPDKRSYSIASYAVNFFFSLFDFLILFYFSYTTHIYMHMTDTFIVNLNLVKQKTKNMKKICMF